MPSSLPPILVFDLDGTLVDSNRDLVPALNASTASVGLPSITHDEVAHFSAQGAKAMIRRAFDFHNQSIEASLLDQLFERFLSHYEAHIADHTVFYPGALEALAEFQCSGWKLAICTNKPEHMAAKLIAELDQPIKFDAISGQNTFRVRKPHPDHLIQTIEMAGGSPIKAIMIGDSKVDIETAKAALIPVIAVDFGYSDQPVDSFNPDKVISHFDQLKTAVDELSELFQAQV